MNKKKTHPGLTKRDRQTVRFLQWIRQYPGFWYMICTPGEEHMTFSMMKNLVQHLAKKELYELIFVMLTVHRNAEFMDAVFKTMLLELILATWKGKPVGKTQLLQNMMKLLT